MFTIFITATNTDVGKTSASLSLIRKISLLMPQLKVGVCKPIETGVTDNDSVTDASKLLTLCKKYNDNFLPLKPQDITAYRFSLPASPYVASKDKSIFIHEIIAKIEQLKKISDILIVEGVGGLMVPIKRGYFVIDLIEDVADLTLLITSSKLGSINDTLLSIEAMERRGIDFEWCVNLYRNREEFEAVTKPFYDDYFGDWWSLQEGLDRFIDKNLSTSFKKNN